MTTPYHAQYFSRELTRQSTGDGIERLSMSLFDASVDLNPHQIEAALYALRSPLSKGVILADEVGLGKTIEAGLVLCQYWAERKRKILVICPALLRKQWSLELYEKFNLQSVILDKRSYTKAINSGNPSPFETDGIVITSMNFASRRAKEIRSIGWDLAVIDEAHKLRNAYRQSNKMGQAIRFALEDTRKLLLTATPLQNTLLELFGLLTIIDKEMFFDAASFRSKYMSKDADLDELRKRLSLIAKRTLRKQVNEYIKYTERKAVTKSFQPTNEEQKLYEAISAFLLRENTYAIPFSQKQLTTLILRKLLASSSHAIAGTLETIKARLEKLRDGLPVTDDLVDAIIQGEDIEDLEEDIEEDEDTETTEVEVPSPEAEEIDRKKLEDEIQELDRYAVWARGIGIDTKTRALLESLGGGFEMLEKMGAARKALIFTESRRTQEYLKNFLEANGFAGKLITFSGTNNGPDIARIYSNWMEANRASGRTTGSKEIDTRTALIENFRDEAEIMIATEAAAEGINLQFCSLVINYDLPWNPQRIEQRIGRCHRYGQLHDVVVINFLNERNQADRRVLQLLEEKFNLFSGVFGASDEVLGTVASGVDFEKRILDIYQQCRTPQEIDKAFKKLQFEMEASIKERLETTRRLLLENFDEDVHRRLKVELDDAQLQLDRISRMFWMLTKFILEGKANFDDQKLSFDLQYPPIPHAKPGRYHMITKRQGEVSGDFLYRLSHPLGEYSIETGKSCPAHPAEVTFDISSHATKVSMVEALKGKKGWLSLQLLVVESFEREEYLLFSCFDEDGKSIDQETCERLFLFDGKAVPIHDIPKEVAESLGRESERHLKATISRSLETNNRFFREERERLERWADDMVYAVEKELADTKAQIKLLNRQARIAATTQEQHDAQLKISELEKKQRRQRQKIFDVEDEIKEKRDKLIDALEKRLSRKTSVQPLFTIRWAVI